MKCFAHETADAIGVCRACGRGTCRECVTLVGRSVACSATCAPKVAILNDMVAKTGPRMRATHKTQAAVFFVIALVCAVAALVADGVGRGVMLCAMALLLLAGVRFYRLATLYKDEQEDATSRPE